MTQRIPELGEPDEDIDQPVKVPALRRLLKPGLVMYMGALIFIAGIFLLAVWLGFCLLGIVICTGAVYQDVVGPRKASFRTQ